MPTPAEPSSIAVPPLSFAVSAEMVQRFARLTGDFSSLHMDADFARRSMYRENVVHGFLPLLFLGALDWKGITDGSLRIQKFSASFLKPVYAGDQLILSPTYLEVVDEQIELEFEISKVETGTLVTSGSAILVKDGDLLRVPGGSADTSLLSTPLTERSLEFADINKDDEAAFRFSVSPDVIGSLQAIYARGGVGQAQGTVQASNLLAAALFSTMVGMCFPGKRATFLNFDVSFSRSIPLNEECRLLSRIAFKSGSTSTISQAISITGPQDTNYASGKIHAQVNTPPSRMPSLQTLAANDLDMGLRGKVVLITGGSRGIGETTAKLFALHGAKVVINYLQSKSEAERIVSEIREHGGEALALQADVSNRAQVAAMVKTVQERFGSVHILVNNAVRDASPIPFLELTWDKLQGDLDVVLKGAFNCCQEVLPKMVEQRSGKIINIATVYIETPPPNQSKYVISKSALVGLTRSLAVEFARHNIQANLVVPSMVETDLSKNVPKIFAEKMKAETPMGRLASPVEVAKAIVFLASSLSSFTTGQKIMVTGGNAPLL